jgi:cold shock CspA family protein
MKGKITQWKDDKGFGFIISEDDQEKLFFHISTVKTQGRRPQVGDVVLYESMRDSQGRLKAKSVVIEGAVFASKTYSKNKIHTEPPKKDILDYVAIVLLIWSLTGTVYSFIQSGGLEKAIPFGVILVVAVILLNRQKKPKEKRFTCARCRKISNHDKRTIKAWNNGFIKLYCTDCHRKWLAEQPKQTQHVSVSSRAGGCLGVSALIVILPIIAGIGVYQWFA